MGIAERKNRERESLRQEIMEAARELFVKEGYGNVSMRKIASRIEYSPTTIYLYFNDKADLMTQICEEAFGRLARRLSSIKADDPVEGLRLGLREYINFGLRHPSHYQLLFNTVATDEPSIQFADSNGKRAFDTLRDSVAECIAAGRLRQTDVDLVSQTLWAGIHGVTSLLITQEHFPFVGRQRLIENVVETLIAGVQK